MKNITFEEHYNQQKNMIYKQWLSFKLNNEHRDDMLQAGRIGLFNALNTYQEDKGAWPTWMITHIRAEMINYINNQMRTVRIPTNQLYSNHSSHNPDNPTQASTSSLDQPINEDTNETFADMLKSDDEIIFNEDDFIITLLRQYLGQLKERYQTILKLRYFQEKTYLEIATELNTSVENIRQLHDKAINQLQELFGAEKKIQKRKRIKPQKR
jgi:RNA polymerase sporulation-specific sigma factor